MGITIKCKKTGTSYDMGAFGFLNLRNKVATLCSKEFGEHYCSLINAPLFNEDRDLFFEEFDKKTLKLIENKMVNIKVVDFCLQPDVEGKIRYGACKVIYNHIKDYDDDICYGYASRPDFFKFKDFKNLLKECYDNKSDLIWM